MKIAIFGATGSVGKHLVNQALDAGHEVTVFVRSPDKLPVKHERLTVMRGNVLEDHDRIRETVAGQHAVMITLGAGAKGRVRSEGTRNIISAMQAAGVRRLICQSTLGAGDSVGNLNLKWRFLFRFPLRLAMADHEQQEAFVQDSDLLWTIVRPSAFSDGELTANYRHGFPATEKKLDLKVSRANVAHFLLGQLESDSYHRQAVSLSC